MTHMCLMSMNDYQVYEWHTRCLQDKWWSQNHERHGLSHKSCQAYAQHTHYLSMMSQRTTYLIFTNDLIKSTHFILLRIVVLHLQQEDHPFVSKKKTFPAVPSSCKAQPGKKPNQKTTQVMAMHYIWKWKHTQVPHTAWDNEIACLTALITFLSF